ncbi:pilus assembly protein [Corallococcus sicarius]|uniref:Pilus assembly protein n=1 Tax=Corallococcus sicarius TaxID=2316726 RepID=A0A3A8NAU5_9BACT|nr:pilus assembly protein [Corallococcus sicarius]RKH41507.1 pilus assembly protein [Corallococcus sicarius]
MSHGRNRTRRARGQAVVEAALGLMVFTSVLVFLIHFSEISIFSVKLTAATHAALLDAPGYQLHEWPMDSDPSREAVVKAAESATMRYADFDGLSRTPGPGTGINQVFTRTDGMTVTCTPNGPGYDPHPFTAVAYSDGGGISCNARAQLTAFRFPQRFAEESQGSSGLFEQEHYAMNPLPVCGIGRAWGGGACSASLTSMLDDWGLTGPDESGQCIIVPDFPGPCPTNAPYWQMAASVYGLSMMVNALGPDFSGSSLALGIVGSLPLPFFYGAENVFWMSAMGEEAGFLQPMPVDPGGYYGPTAWVFAWPTTPGAIPPGPFLGAVPYPISFGQRDGCFLGKNCP